ncbi:MAG: HD-GYP domain-containing protein [Betaproteobacteria bacterium]|nr:HD-GYP domain-containing protein [Betaproteobacteria bacterium]
MSGLSFVILRQLALAGILGCLLVGVGFNLIEERGINDFLLALTTPQSEDLVDANAGEQDIYKIMLEAVHRRSVIAQVFDNEWNPRGETADPRHDSLRPMLEGRTQTFPRDAGRHKHIIRIGEAIVVQIQIPVFDADEAQAGFLSGAFVVPGRISEQLQQHFRYAMLAVVAAVLLTAVLLYPMILALNRQVLQTSHQIMRGNLEMAVTLGTAIAKRDSDTGSHNYRVCFYALRLGEAVKLNAADIRRLIIGSFFHDIGKIGISDTILLKPGKLDDEEFAAIKQHVSLGLEITRSSEWLRSGSDVIEFHHEKFNGSGYLKQLRGEEIPLLARIFAIVDVFDALASRRPYKEAMSSEEAIALVREGAGSHFDPRLVDIFAGMATRLHTEVANLGEKQLGNMLLQKISYYFLMPDKVPLMP